MVITRFINPPNNRSLVALDKEKKGAAHGKRTRGRRNGGGEAGESKRARNSVDHVTAGIRDKAYKRHCLRPRFHGYRELNIRDAWG